ncbi:MAG TPA: glutamate-5-semialdehyde dehydrogenase [Xanthomonadales bacterium]|nr:glutamate-5-semialdehyde dehydrogenase [Xanthomonadales bacterium]
MDKSQLQQDMRTTRNAARALTNLGDELVRAVLFTLAGKVDSDPGRLLEANQRDLARMDPEDPKYDRLMLNPERLESIASDIRRVASLDSPVGHVLERRLLENGLNLEKITVPMGVIAVIYESRPNVTFDVFALCFKSHNACILKGSRDAVDSNQAAIELIHQSLIEHNISPEVALLTPADRAALPLVLEAVDDIDLAIPRGSRGLIDFVRDHARIPVIETGAGIVHTYVDASADFEKARAIVTNAKARRVSVCNALDTLVIHRDWLKRLPEMLEELGGQYDTRVFADESAFLALQDYYQGPLERARKEHFGQEFLSHAMSIRTVDSLAEALEHIYEYSSRHSEAVVAEDRSVIEKFLSGVDAAAVYANASTAFTDGGQFGMGAEIGISTQKLHARGPMALPELTSYKWVIRGDGQIRP